MPKISNMAEPPVGGRTKPFPRLALESALDQRATAFGQRAEGFVRWNGGAELVVVPRSLRLRRLLDLEQIHRMDLAPVGAHRALAEQLVVGRHLFHLGHDRLAVGIALELLDLLEIVRYSRAHAGLPPCP